jgi:hypothetical protein
MARTRNIKPGFFANEELAKLGPQSQIVFAGLWCWADREGRLEDRPARLKAQIAPYHDIDMVSILDGLAKSDEHFITRYVGSDGRKYIAINKFQTHQNPHCKESESTIPAPDKNDANTILAGPSPNLLNPSPNLLNLTKNHLAPGKPGSCLVSDTAFNVWWQVYPKKSGKQAAHTAYIKAIKRIRAVGQTADEAHKTLLEAVRRYATSPKSKSQYCWNPATWLNGGHWEDDPAVWNRGDFATTDVGVDKRALASLDDEMRAEEARLAKENAR